MSTLQCIHHRGVETPRCIHIRGVETLRCIHHKGVKTPHSSVYSSLGSHFGHRGVVLPIWMNIQQALKATIILKTDCRLFWLLRDTWFKFEKLSYPRDSNRLPGVFITGESISNVNTCKNMWKYYKSFLDVPIRAGRSCLISRDTVPLRKNQQLIKNDDC
jgi:hypothetical protein